MTGDAANLRLIGASATCLSGETTHDGEAGESEGPKEESGESSGEAGDNIFVAVSESTKRKKENIVM